MSKVYKVFRVNKGLYGKRVVGFVQGFEALVFSGVAEAFSGLCVLCKRQGLGVLGAWVFRD